MLKGQTEGLPYSFSRWTDVPAAKWAWMQQAIKEQRMLAFDPRSAIPGPWSLDPADTLGLVFWTKDPTNLIYDAPWLSEYRYKVHVTATAWHEVEKGAPNPSRSAYLLQKAAEHLGAANVVWRFSPVPMVSDVVERFARVMRDAAYVGVRDVYVSFLQTNDLVPETRSEEERLNILKGLAEVSAQYGEARVRLCNEDRLLAGRANLAFNLSSGVCAPPSDFAVVRDQPLPSEGCGCVLMVDPFTFNESCTMGCTYCYAADKSLSPKKRNTTLTVLR